MRKIILVILAWVSTIYANEILTGKIIRVIDGDSVVLTNDGLDRNIRLAYIDAPEYDQPYGEESRYYLHNKIFGQTVEANCIDIDKYNRDVCILTYNKVNINRDMVEHGMAWVFERYNQDGMLPALQYNAQNLKLGLWGLSDSQQIKPQDWRRNKKTQQIENNDVQANASNNYQCGSKKTCKQMSNCEEANYYLQHCGLTRLDRDKDGIPCESLCR